MIKNQCFYFLLSSTRKLAHLRPKLLLPFKTAYRIQIPSCPSALCTHTECSYFLAPKVAVAREESFAEKLLSVPELASLPGPLFRSSEAIQLTESETEYVVKCIKHSFPHHLVLQVLYLSHLIIVLTN